MVRSMYQLADSYIAHSNFAPALTIADQLTRLAQTTSTPRAAFYAEHIQGAVAFFSGQLGPARRHFEQAIAAYDVQPTPQVGDTLANTAVSHRVWLAQVLWALGYVEQALTRCREAVALARTLDHAVSLGIALILGELGIRQFRREPAAMRASLRDLAVLDQVAHLRLLQPFRRSMQGWLAVVMEQDPAGLDQIQQALQQLEATGTQIGRSQHYILLAEAQLTLAQHTAALETLTRMRELMSVTGMRFFAAEAARLQGEALRRLGRTAEAKTCFQEALTAAREQAAKAWELRAALSLCRLYQAEGPPAAYQTARAVGRGVRLVHRRARHAGFASSGGAADRDRAAHPLLKIVTEDTENAEPPSVYSYSNLAHLYPSLTVNATAMRNDKNNDNTSVFKHFINNPPVPNTITIVPR